jgi:hypothetical protein
MYAQRRDRRYRDRETQRAAANRRIGHDHAYLIMFGPTVVKLIGLAGVGAALAWVWLNVDHHRISLVVAGLGILCALVYAIWFAWAGNAHARMMRRAQGELLTLSMWWHLVALAAVLLFAAAYLIDRP